MYLRGQPPQVQPPTPILYIPTNTPTHPKATIYEGLRIHPPLHNLLTKVVPPQGDTLDGKFVPGGTKIAANKWSLLRDKAVFGEDVDIFRPERFLADRRFADAKDSEMGTNSQKITEMERHVELAFGYGRYACAGKTIAMMELFKFFFEVGFNSLCNWSVWVRFHANWVGV